MGCNCKNKSFINPDGSISANLNEESKPYSWVRFISILVKIFFYTLTVFVVLPLILMILNKGFNDKVLFNSLINVGKFLNGKIKSNKNKNDNKFDISEYNEEDLILTDVDDLEKEKQYINV